MTEKLTMKSDYVFCEFFSRKGNENFLKDFLSAILKVEIRTIEIIQQANLGKVSKNNKHGVIDIKATLNDGIVTDIEMQVDDKHNWEKRVTYYAGKLIAADLGEGDDYEKLRDTVIISILNYNLTDLPEYITESITVAEKHREYELVKGIKYYFIELPKFRKENPDMNDKLNQWLAFIDGENRGWIKMAQRTNEQIDKAVEEYIKLKGDREVVEIAEARLDSIRCERAMKKRAREEGLAEGREEGLKQGIKEGMKEGIKEGEKNKQREIAKNLLKKGFSVKEIAEITKLTENEIKKIGL